MTNPQPKTVDELMEGKQPGEIKITLDFWDAGFWFQPFYKLDGRWYGPTKKLAAVYGYGNLIHRLKEAWSESLQKEYFLDKDDADRAAGLRE